MNGCNYYTTGTLFADWINIAAQHENGEQVSVVLSRHAAGPHCSPIRLPIS
jgi:hypothetical protein